MKKFILAAMVLCTSMVYAAEVTVMEAPVAVSSYQTMVDTRFHMDQKTGEGFVKVSVTEYRPGMGGYYDRYGRRFPDNTPTPVTIFQKTVKVEGLMLMGDQVMYHGAEGNVDCGKMGVSRVFKKPTIYLNGNCTLDGNVMGRWNNSRVVVVLKTK